MHPGPLNSPLPHLPPSPSIIFWDNPWHRGCRAPPPPALSPPTTTASISGLNWLFFFHSALIIQAHEPLPCSCQHTWLCICNLSSALCVCGRPGTISGTTPSGWPGPAGGGGHRPAHVQAGLTPTPDPAGGERAEEWERERERERKEEMEGDLWACSAEGASLS